MLGCACHVVVHLASHDKESDHDRAGVWKHAMESLGGIHAVGLHACLKKVEEKDKENSEAGADRS